jgi:hypothetical protein
MATPALVREATIMIAIKEATEIPPRIVGFGKSSWSGATVFGGTRVATVGEEAVCFAEDSN